MKKIIMFTLISMLAVVVLVGCEGKGVNGNTPPPNAKLMAPTVVGEVLEVKDKSILVESTSDNAKGKIMVSIDDKTYFFENIAEGTSIPYKNVSRKFAVGNHVEIFIQGGVKESSPMQGTASAVYINEVKK